MIFYDSDDSNTSSNSVIYNNSYDSTKDNFSSTINNRNFSSTTTTRNVSYNTSVDNSYKSQNYIDIDIDSKESSYKSQNYIDSKDNIYKSQNYIDIKDNSYKSQNYIDSKDNSYKSQNYIDKVRYDKFKRIQNKNLKLKFKIVLQELLLNKTKNLLYKSNYNIVIKELENKELKKYYELGMIYKKFIKDMDSGVKLVVISKEKCIEMAKKQIQIFKDKKNIEAVNKLEEFYINKYGNEFKNDTKK